MRTGIFTATILGGALAASAHLGALTAPATGSTVTPGQVLAIKWAMGTAHNTQDLAYSQDGSTWTTITTGLGANATTYNWTVPDKPSATTRVRVCQRDGAQVQGCTNAHNTQQLTNGIAVTGGEVYTAISGNFTISGSTGITHSFSASDAKLSFNASLHSVTVAFTLSQRENVTLKAFNAQGKLLAVLLDGQKAEGPHSLSVFSNALDRGSPMVFRLQVGDKVLQHDLAVGR